MFSLDELLKLTEDKPDLMNVNAITLEQHIDSTPYFVEKTIHRGDLSFTYFGFNTVTNVPVIIKEFFPLSDFVFENETMALTRTDDDTVMLKVSSEKKEQLFHTLKHRFREDMRCLQASRRNRYVVNILDTFLANNTSYVVLEYLPFPTLNTVLKNKLLTPKEVLALYYEILTAVQAIHHIGHLHKGIKPTNIYITDKHIILGEYSVINASGLKLNHGSLYKDIFVAPELYEALPIGRTTDVYALGKILEYLMEHIGYRSGRMKNMDMGKNFNIGQIDYLLKSCTNPNPMDRIQGVDEIVVALSNEEMKVKEPFELFKWFLACSLMIIAVFMVMRSGLLDQVKVDKNPEITKEIILTHQSDFTILDEKVAFEFDDEMVLSWSDTHSDYYQLMLDFDDNPCCQEIFVVQNPYFDFKGLSLNPGHYNLIIKDDKDHQLYYAFRVDKPYDVEWVKKPIFEYDDYHFYLDEKQELLWDGDDDINTVLVIYNTNTMSLVSEQILAQNKIDLNLLKLEPDNYLLSIRKTMENGMSYYDHASVSIYEDSLIKCPILNIRNHAKLQADARIEWLPVDGQVSIKMLHLESNETITLDIEPGQNEVVLSDYDLPLGAYEIFVSNQLSGHSSEILKKHLSIVAK